MTRNITCVGLILAASLLALPSVVAQIADTPQSRMRPIGSPSAVDQYRSSIKRADYHETNARHHQADRPRNNSAVRQTVWMQHGNAPPLLNEGRVALPNQFSPAPNPGASVLLPPPANIPFPANPQLPANSPLPPRLNPVPTSDYAPLNQPRLGDQFATLDNSCHVSGPSVYTAASASGCCTPVNYQAPPAYIAPPAPVSPPSIIGVPAAPFATSVPIVAAPTGVPASPLVSFGQEQYQVQVGPGLFGQPVAYVPGQTFRNWVRYIFP